MEEYRIIYDYPGYSVSNFGNVKNNITDRILKPQNDTNGYYIVNLCKEGKQKTFRVHRAVSLAFIPNPLNRQCTDHLDNNRHNNNVNNLRWVSSQENSMNRSKASNNTSGNKGVCFNKRDKKWVAHIKINGKSKTLGYFHTKEEAVAVRKAKANELFGEFTNKIEKIKSELEELEEEFQRLIN